MDRTLELIRVRALVLCAIDGADPKTWGPELAAFAAPLVPLVKAALTAR